MKLRNIIALTMSIATLAISSSVFAQAEDPGAKAIRGRFLGGVARELRTEPYSFTMDVPSTAAATDITVGADGVIFATSINTNATPTAGAKAIGALPYPCKLDVKVHDDGNADTLVCATVLIRGFNQFGEPVDEIVLPNAETVAETQHVYEVVTYIAGAGCTSNSGDANDVLRVSASAEIGLPFRITSKDAIMNFSLWDLSATELFTFRPDQLTVDMKEMSVETDNLTPTLAAGDVVMFRLVAPAGK